MHNTFMVQKYENHFSDDNDKERDLSLEERFRLSRREEERRSAAEEEMFRHSREKRLREEENVRAHVRRLRKELAEKQDMNSSNTQKASAEMYQEAHEDKFSPGRRSFLKKALLGAGALFGGWGLSKFLPEEEPAETRLTLNDFENETCFPAYVRETGNIISFQKETVLNTETMDALKEYWKDVFQGKKDHENENGDIIEYDISGAYRRMLKYDEAIEAEFDKEGISPDLRFLSIIESNWNNFGEKYSRKTAGGPFQFMAETAVHYDLIIDENESIDERFDPIKSARAAAKYLSWMLKGNGGDPRMALHEYNGSFALRYRLAEKREPSYRAFLEQMEDQINKRRLVMKRLEEKYFIADMKEGWDGGILGNYAENIKYTAKVMAVIELVNDPGWRWKNGFA